MYDDKKPFELLVLSGALSELTCLPFNKHPLFRKVSADFDPMLVGKINEKKLVGPGNAVLLFKVPGNNTKPNGIKIFMSRNPTRYYQDTPGGKFNGLRPDVVDSETRKLLGIRELDPPPWLNNMWRLVPTRISRSLFGRIDKVSSARY